MSDDPKLIVQLFGKMRHQQMANMFRSVREAIKQHFQSKAEEASDPDQKAELYRMASETQALIAREGDKVHMEREIKEKKGSRKGAKKRTAGAEFIKGDLMDEISAIHRPDKNAEWHRQKLKEEAEVNLGLRTMQRYLNKIRENR